MLTYEGDPPVVCKPFSAVQRGRPDTCSVTELSLSSHSGTHVDAPCHFVLGGAGVDEVPLSDLCGPARVVDLTKGPRTIDAETLESLSLDGVERLLLKTSNGDLLDEPFTTDYAHLGLSGATWVRDHGLRLVGIDYLSVEAPGSSGFPVHHTLLEAEPPVIIVEGLDLRPVEAGDYDLCVLPLCLAGGDGAPARAMVRARS